MTTLVQDNWGICYRSDYFPHHIPTPERLQPTQAALKAQPVTQGGRQAAWFIQLPLGQEAVLRQYRRGGFIARVFYDHYVWCGAHRTRSWAEFKIMQYLQAQHVPVPTPIWASWQRTGVYYRAALITERIPQAHTLASQLFDTDPEMVAQGIKKMHDAGVYHADLNAFNILLDAQKSVWLIDFDRARRYQSLSFSQRKKNLHRLHRSLVKIQGQAGARWYQFLIQAYQALF